MIQCLHCKIDINSGEAHADGCPNNLENYRDIFKPSDKDIARVISNIKKDFQKGITRPCRVPTKTWRYMLLNNHDTVVVDGKVRQLTAKSIGAGVYEVTLKA